MNIFFFGGSFDPPHKAHKLIYKNCIELCEKFIFIPSSQTPGKCKPIVEGHLRIEMLKSIIDKEDREKVIIEPYEINSQIKPNYTINTIKYLKKMYKNSNFTMIIGGDQYENMHDWYCYEDIIQLVNIICYKRKNKNAQSNKKINFIDFDVNISSTEIRKSIANGQIQKIKNFLNKGTIDIINSNNLYNTI